MYEQRDRTFTGVSVLRKNYVVFSAVDDELAEKGIDHAVVFRYADEKWSKKTLEIATRGSFAIEDGKKIFNLGINGKAVILTLPGVSEEIVDGSADGPSDLLTLRAAKVIDQEIYAAGMGRHFYKRTATGTWLRVDDEMFSPREERRHAVGLNAIAGYSASDIYAAGYAGEVWHFDGSSWSREDSPVDVTLNAITCAPDGVVYAAGMAGTIVRGSKGGWKALPRSLTNQDFFGMASFDGRMYFASYDGIFRLDGDSLQRVGIDRALSTAYLDAADGVMWSVGQKDLAWTNDGSSWVKVDSP